LPKNLNLPITEDLAAGSAKEHAAGISFTVDLTISRGPVTTNRVFVYSSGVRPLFDVHTTKESDMTTHETGPDTASSEGTVTVTETGSGTYTQQITAGHHRLVADEPRPIGDDAGPTPYDLLLAALGTCTSMTVRMYAARKGWPLERVRVTLRHSRIHAKDCVECETTSGWIHHIDRDIELAGDLDDAQRQRLFHRGCPGLRGI
jgi:putative redox protein